MLIGRLISGNSRDASASLLAGHAGLQCHVLTRHSLANAFFRTRPIAVLDKYKSDKMARVITIVTTMRFREERIHSQDSGQRVSISYFCNRACSAGLGAAGADRAAAARQSAAHRRTERTSVAACHPAGAGAIPGGSVARLRSHLDAPSRGRADPIILAGRSR